MKEFLKALLKLFLELKQSSTSNGVTNNIELKFFNFSTWKLKCIAAPVTIINVWSIEALSPFYTIATLLSQDQPGMDVGWTIGYRKWEIIIFFTENLWPDSVYSILSGMFFLLRLFVMFGNVTHADAYQPIRCICVYFIGAYIDDAHTWLMIYLIRYTGLWNSRRRRVGSVGGGLAAWRVPMMTIGGSDWLKRMVWTTEPKPHCVILVKISIASNFTDWRRYKFCNSVVDMFSYWTTCVGFLVFFLVFFSGLRSYWIRVWS